MNATIERLRAEEEDRATENRWTVKQGTALVTNVSRGWTSLDEISELIGRDSDDVLNTCVELGVWLTHVHGGAKVDTIEASHTGRLFACNEDEEAVVIPPGFEKSAPHGRDVAKSLAAVVVYQPDEEELARWLARKYPSDTAVLTFPMVSAVWKFAQLGRLDDIDEVSPHSVFRQLAVQAHDVLQVAIDDALAGARTIARYARADVTEVAEGVQELRDAASKLSWLQPKESGKLAELAEMTMERPETVRALLARVRTLGRLMAARPQDWHVEDIGGLNQGHVEQIARRAGLSVEGVSRAEESAIRHRLAEMGLKADADRLVPEGVRALLSGVEDTFWEAMELRASGDTSWRKVLADAYAEVAKG